MSKEIEYIDKMLDVMACTVDHIGKTDKQVYTVSMQMLNMLEVLAAKGLLDPSDLRYIRESDADIEEDDKPAHWMKVKSHENHISEWECSNCKATFQCEGDIDFPYCPRCGKEMEV